MFCISFVVVVVRSRLIGFDRRFEEAARDLGADAFTTFRKVTLPLIMPGIVGAAMLSFALSIDDFVISNFNSGTTVTFPLYIFGAAQRGIPVEVNVIATILFAVTVLAMAFTIWQQGARREARGGPSGPGGRPARWRHAVPAAPGVGRRLSGRADGERLAFPRRPPGTGSAAGDKGLKAGALGYLSNLVIGVASTAPGYSLAATLGFVVAARAWASTPPAVMLVSFIPMLLHRGRLQLHEPADPDCGTSFTWVTKAMGPRLGWLTGWAIVVADIVVMATLALHRRRLHVPALRLAGGRRLTSGGQHRRPSSGSPMMTWICYVGIELSAKTQYGLLTMEIFTLALFAVVALIKTYAGNGLPGSMDPSFDGSTRSR